MLPAKERGGRSSQEGTQPRLRQHLQCSSRLWGGMRKRQGLVHGLVTNVTPRQWHPADCFSRSGGGFYACMQHELGRQGEARAGEARAGAQCPPFMVTSLRTFNHEYVFQGLIICSPQHPLLARVLGEAMVTRGTLLSAGSFTRR